MWEDENLKEIFDAKCFSVKRQERLRITENSIGWSETGGILGIDPFHEYWSSLP
jgi:hypothetical protein